MAQTSVWSRLAADIGLSKLLAPYPTLTSGGGGNVVPISMIAATAPGQFR